MIVFFICRILSAFIVDLIVSMTGRAGYSAYYLSYVVIVLMVYVLPLLVTAIVFDSFKKYKGKMREMYARPKRLARALGTFPAMYGLGYGLALLTLLIGHLISRLNGGQIFIEDILRPTVIQPPTNLASILIMVFLLVVIAPIFEEIWTRGIMYDALKPYGYGVAIVFSSILFGLMHGSMHMLLYTTAVGFALGYVRYATDSLFVVTILHMLFNLVAAGLLFFTSLAEITYGQNRLVNTLLSVYIFAVLILILVGVIAFLTRIPTIRKYRIVRIWQDVSKGRKMALFFSSIPVIIMLIFAINEHANNWLLGLIL